MEMEMDKNKYGFSAYEGHWGVTSDIRPNLWSAPIYHHQSSAHIEWKLSTNIYIYVMIGVCGSFSPNVRKRTANKCEVHVHITADDPTSPIYYTVWLWRLWAEYIINVGYRQLLTGSRVCTGGGWGPTHVLCFLLPVHVDREQTRRRTSVPAVFSVSDVSIHPVKQMIFFDDFLICWDEPERHTLSSCW